MTQPTTALIVAGVVNSINNLDDAATVLDILTSPRRTVNAPILIDVLDILQDALPFYDMTGLTTRIADRRNQALMDAVTTN